ncbi:GNAT family N-acetyltransferase [Tenacibaculum pacificus]|uniref:GNAT family N-acetyltransferase n=1 Tax=Tenacibaculum pacificus TaxID=3018314 RepID=UPI0022F38D78|nr:GNAT family N-acetyltransferase [Tenacibaculum pacificus]WBX72579.1 GNAT family N-acetyltransferase [Tenacibaculum pacificus]
MHKEFESERLLIRPTLKQDAELIYELMNTPKFIKYVGDRELNSIKDAEKYIEEKMLSQLNTHGYSTYSLIGKSDGRKVGTCGLYDRDGLEGIDIGFGLLPKYEGVGYAYESASILIKAAIHDFEIKEIKGITSKENISSQKLLEKLGLEMVGTKILPNESEELLLYKLKI